MKLVFVSSVITLAMAIMAEDVIEIELTTTAEPSLVSGTSHPKIVAVTRHPDSHQNETIIEEIENAAVDAVKSAVHSVFGILKHIAEIVLEPSHPNNATTIAPESSIMSIKKLTESSNIHEADPTIFVKAVTKLQADEVEKTTTADLEVLLESEEN